MKTFPMPGGSPVWHGNLASDIRHPATSKSRIKEIFKCCETTRVCNEQKEKRDLPLSEDKLMNMIEFYLAILALI